MEITYQRDARGSHMVISGERKEIGFEEEMLKQNEIPVLLNFYEMEWDGEYQLWYDINGKKSLRDFVEQEGVTVENLQMIFQYISLAYQSVSEYLINEENIYVSPDTVFMENKKSAWTMSLIYCPMEHPGFFDQLRSIMEFYISAVDHRQKEVTALCYQLYAITEQEDFSLGEILETLQSGYKTQESYQEDVSRKETSFDEVDGPKEDTSVEYDILNAEPGSELPFVDWEEVEVMEERDKHPRRSKQFKHFRHLGKKKRERKETEEKTTISKASFGERLREWLERLMKKLSHHREELFPPKDELQDLEFEPEEEYEETGLLTLDGLTCQGKLLYEGVGKGGQDYTISHTPFRIGSKEKNNDAVLHSSVVSRYHAKITSQNGIYYVEDLNSRNGTFLNGKPIPYHKATPIKPMDVLSFADVTYRVV